jgi:radical SAM superfamily enzyme YgiQ (UPF0313 family)
MSKKVVLINLPAEYLTEPDAQFPLGLLYLGTELKQSGFDVQILDFANNPCIEIPEADVYGITATSMQIPVLNQFVEKRLADKNGIIVAGGYCSHSPQYITDKVNAIVCNHADSVTINSIIKDFEPDKPEQNIKPLYVGKQSPNIELIPDRSLIGYKGGNIFAQKSGEQSTQLITSFGCNSGCAFCASANSGITFRNIETVISEIRQIVEMGIYNIRIADDNFTVNEQRINKFCNALEKNRMLINFRISVRVHPFKKYILAMLKKVGLKEVSLGIESFDQKVLNGLNKKTTVKQNLNAIEICNELDIPVRLLVMIGTPYQTEDTIKINIDILKNIKYNIAAVSQFKPLPGSDIWNNPEKYDCEILSRDLSLYNFYSYQNKQIKYQDSIIKLKDIPLNETNKQNREFLEWVREHGINEG